MGKSKRRITPFKWLFGAATAASAAGNWYTGLTTLWQLAVSIGTALVVGVGSLLGIVGVSLPGGTPAWLGFLGHALLLGLGACTLVVFFFRSFKQLQAPRVFRDLPLEHKEQIVAILDAGTWRVSRSKAIYVDLSGKGLIRDSVSLASNQAMVRLTPLGQRLAQQWKESEEYKDRLLPPGPSGQERASIEEMRVFWREYARKAWKLVDRLLRQGGGDLIQKTDLAMLLSEPLHALEAARLDMDVATDDPSGSRLNEIKARFVKFYGAYLDGCRWLESMSKEGIVWDEDPYNDLYRRWGAMDTRFRKKLGEFMQRSDFGDLEQPVILTSFDDRDAPW